MNKKYVINIGRQLGSGGKEIGEKLAQELNISFYDKELLHIAAQESGLSTETFEKADEEASQGVMGSFFGLRMPFINNSIFSYSNNYLTSDTLFKIQSDVIRELAKQKSCLFVGRCADYILRDNPRCVNVFIVSSKDFRLERVQRTFNVTKEKAEELIEKTDKRRASYYNYYSYKAWGTAESYHLCVDSSVLGTEGTIKFIKKFAEEKLNL